MHVHIHYSRFFQSIYDWKCVLTGGKPKFYFGGVGRNRNYWYDQDSQIWKRCPDSLKFDMPSRTLIYAEEVIECRGEGNFFNLKISPFS